MSELPKPLDISVWGAAGRVLHFEQTENVIRWAEQEVKNWTFDDQPQVRLLLDALNNQKNQLLSIATYSRQIESLLQSPQPGTADTQQAFARVEGSLKRAFDSVSAGTTLTSEHPSYRFIAGLAGKDIDAAALLLMASLSNAGQVLSNYRQSIPLDAIARIATGIAAMADDKDVTAYKDNLASVSNDADKCLASIHKTLSDEVARSEAAQSAHSSGVEMRNLEWADLLERCNEEWAALKTVYDEKLSLLAPTEYWTAQAERYRTQGILYAVAFALVLAGSITLFILFGLPALHKQDVPSALLASLPVIIPAFAGIWVLRILGRQLAESLAIMKDATERVTLVKTFLALMRDETQGKAVVTDEDRALILTALFRQSRVTAADDSPPLNSVDSLLRFAKHPN